MRRRDFYWALYYRPQNNQLTDLRTDQVEAIFAAIPQSIRSDYLVWKEGFRTWKPFEEFPVLVQDLRNSREVSVAAPPPVPSPGKRVEEVEDEFEWEIHEHLGSPSDEKKEMKPAVVSQPRVPQITANAPTAIADLTLGNYLAEELRKSPRFSIEFGVRIEIQGQVFKSKTVNVSMLGLQIQDPLPEWTPRYFTVELYSDEGVISLMCSKLKGKNGHPKTRIRIESNDNCEVLRRWLTYA